MEPPFRPYRSQLTRASRGKNQILRKNAEGSLTRAPGGTKHQLSIRPRNLSCSCGTPSKMGSTRLPARAPPEAGRSLAGLRRRLESMRRLPSFLPTFSASVLLITRDGLPLFVLSLSALSLSLRLLRYSPRHSPHPSAFFLFLGTPAHPAVMSALISLTWP